MPPSQCSIVERPWVVTFLTLVIAQEELRSCQDLNRLAFARAKESVRAEIADPTNHVTLQRKIANASNYP